MPRRIALVLLHWGAAASVFFALIASSFGVDRLGDAVRHAMTLTTAGVLGGDSGSWVLAGAHDGRNTFGFCAEVAVAVLYLTTGARATRWVLTALVAVRVAYVSLGLAVTLSGV